MMANDLAAANAVLKVGYGDIHEQMDLKLWALNMIESGAQHLNKDNVEAQFAIHVGRNQSFGSRNEMDDLPEAGQNRDARASVYLKYHYASIQATGQLFAQVTGNTESFVDFVKREMDTVKDGANRNLTRQVYGDGTGTLAIVATGATGSNTLVVDDAHWLVVDMTIDVLTAATLGNPTPTKGNTALLKITSVNSDTNTITVSGGTVTAAAGSALVLASGGPNGGANDWKKEWEGLGLIVSKTAPLHGISPVAEPLWAAAYIENNVGPLAEIDFDHALEAVKNTGGTTTDLITTPRVARAYWNLLQGMRQFNGNEQMKGGTTKPKIQSIFGDIDMTLDFDAPAGTAYFLNRKELFLHREHGWNWIDRMGSMWVQIPGKDAFKATMSDYSNIGCYRRNSFAKLTGIQEL
jgi:hypothetical protein